MGNKSKKRKQPIPTTFYLNSAMMLKPFPVGREAVGLEAVKLECEFTEITKIYWFCVLAAIAFYQPKHYK